MLEASIKNSGGYNRHVVVASLLLRHVVVAHLFSSHFISGVMFCGIQLVAYLDNTCLPMLTTQALLAATLPNTDQMLWYTASNIQPSLGPLHVLFPLIPLFVLT